jgi:hypothetical protein
MNRIFGTLRMKPLKKNVFVMVCVLVLVPYSLVSTSYINMLTYVPGSASQQNQMNEDGMAQLQGQNGADFAKTVVDELFNATIEDKLFKGSTEFYQREELPYSVTFEEKVFPRPQELLDTPNFYDLLNASDSLPSTKECFICLHGWNEKSQGNCENCADVCPGFCSKLCHEKVEPKFVSKELTTRPPLKSRDPDRIIPRIIHQTWFEELSPDKYPNLSKYSESFRTSGWEYKFYTDEDAAGFMSAHFPPEFRDVFDTLIAGAYKADFFRYCVLFIHGGIYSDVDIQLRSNLDVSVPPDVGFMVPWDRVSTTRNATYAHDFKLDLSLLTEQTSHFIHYSMFLPCVVNFLFISCSPAEDSV